MSRRRLACALLLLASARGASAEGGTEWPSWGNDPGGARYADLRQISPENVARLEIAWSYRTGDVYDADRGLPAPRAPARRTPLLLEGTLYFCTPSTA